MSQIEDLEMLIVNQKESQFPNYNQQYNQKNNENKISSRNSECLCKTSVLEEKNKIF